jgi:hypothetical protein
MQDINPCDLRGPRPTPRGRLARHIDHWRERPELVIEAVTRRRLDLTFLCGHSPREVVISLPRVKGFFEEEGR